MKGKLLLAAVVACFISTGVLNADAATSTVNAAAAYDDSYTWMIHGANDGATDGSHNLPYGYSAIRRMVPYDYWEVYSASYDYHYYANGGSNNNPPGGGGGGGGVPCTGCELPQVPSGD